jgi:opine dehydrogenase
MSEKKLVVCICGGGSGAHVTAGYLGNKPEFIVNVYTRQPQKWIDGMKEHGGMTVHTRRYAENDMVTIVGKINKVSSDAKDVAPEADIFLLGGPSHAQPHLLQGIAPYVKKGAFIGALYGQGGVDWAAKHALGDKFKDVTIFALQHIPWICTTITYGKECKMIGPKKFLLVSAVPLAQNDACARLSEKLFDIPTKTLPNFLCLTLTPSNQIIHPPRYYGIFKDWDGKKVYQQSEIPLLYEGMDDLSADLMQGVSDELQSIKKALEKRYPTIDLSSVKDLGQRIVEQYGVEVKDTSSLKQIFVTNKGYAGCKTPVIPVEGGVIPKIEGRFFVEDIPFGLCILRDLADMLHVDVPLMNKFIIWHQGFMKKDYLKDGHLNDELIMETGAPKRYGFTDLDALVQDYLPK